MVRTQRPQSLEAALDALAVAATEHRALTPIAGGTDVFPALLGGPAPNELLDLSNVSSLKGISVIHLDGVSFLRIGAMTPWSALAQAGHPALREPAFEALVMAAAEVGGQQIQNRGTLGGNLCNASPAADGVPALAALEARVQLRSRGGLRTLAVDAFIVGPRRTALAPGELLEAVLLPMPGPARQHSTFVKLGHRRYLVISAVMLGAMLRWNPQGRVVACALSVGACGPVAVRLGGLEARLLGLQAPQVLALASQPLPGDTLGALAPIGDLRGSAGYRLDAAATLVGRALQALARHPGLSARTPEPSRSLA